MIDYMDRPIPYKDKGIDPSDGLDCYGVIRWVLNTETSLDLPPSPPSATSWPRYVKIIHAPFPDFQRLDVIMFSDVIPGLANHVGVMISGSDFLHSASVFGGMVCEPINRYKHKIIAMGRPLV